MTKALLHELGKSLSFGRLSLKAKVLWPMLLSTSDDQGRGTAETDAIKWYVCPNVPEIQAGEVSGLLDEMAVQGMVHLYENDSTQVYQAVHWWQYQQLRWARPSRWAAPEGWTDRIRYSNRGDMHDNDGWYTTGGFDAEPIESAKTRSGKKVPEVPADNCTELPQKILETSNLTQPNSTQPNLTQPNSTPSCPNTPPPRARPPPLERKTITPDKIPKPDPVFGGLWRDEILPDLRMQVDTVTFEEWFVPVQPLAVQDGAVCLAVNEHYQIPWCSRVHGPRLRRICSAILGQPLDIQFIAMAQPGGT